MLPATLTSAPGRLAHASRRRVDAVFQRRDEGDVAGEMPPAVCAWSCVTTR